MCASTYLHEDNYSIMMTIFDLIVIYELVSGLFMLITLFIYWGILNTQKTQVNRFFFKFTNFIIICLQ